MNKKRIRVTADDRERIKDAIAAAESKTSGELVAYIARASDEYWWVHGFWALVALVGVSCFVFAESRLGLGWPILKILGYQALGLLLGFLLPFIPVVKRLTVPKKCIVFYVQRSCLAMFLKAGLTETRDRTGVLIYLSKLERRVVIWADKGIYSTTPPEVWQRHVDTIVKGIHSGTSIDVLCEVIAALGNQLAEKFPRKSDDTNEISDDLQTE